MEIDEALAQVEVLRSTLSDMVKRDPEQEIRDIAIPVLDAVLQAVKPLLADHPVVTTISDLMSAERVANEDPLRAADMLHVVNALNIPLVGLHSEWRLRGGVRRRGG